MELSEAERLLTYRRIRTALIQAIRMHLLLRTRLALIPQRK
jgi:hypothetical protein